MTATAASIALRLTPPVRYVLRIADTALKRLEIARIEEIGEMPV